MKNEYLFQFKSNHFIRIALCLLLSLSISPLLNAQNALIGSGFAPGWSNPSNLAYMSASAGSSRIITANPGGTGNQYFRLVRAWSGNNSEFSPSASCCGGCDAALSGFDTEVFAANTNCTNGAWYINCPNTTDNYVFKTPDGATGTSFVVFRVQGAVRNVSSVSQTPTAGSVAVSQPVVVTANLSGALSTGQAVYIRYTTNGYATSTVAQMSFVSSTSYQASIPGFAASTNVSYYIFTSGASNVASNGSNADLYTINLNNNGGSNYSYTVSNLYLSAATGSYNTGSTWLGGAVPPSGAAIQILNGHNVTLNTNATVSSITINSGGTFTGADGSARTLTVSNGTSGTTFSNSGTWSNGTGGSTVVFSGTAVHTISGTQTLQNVSTFSGLNFGSNSTISNSFQLNSGGYVATSPATYGSTSTLIYNTGGTYGRGLEWSSTSGAGYPKHVQISGNTTLNLGNGGTGTARACAGNLTVDDGSTLSMNVGGSVMTAPLTVNGNIILGSSGTATLTLSSGFGGDLEFTGNWTRNGTSILNNNSRQVRFIGGLLQTITGQTTFDYLRVNNAAGVTLSNAITVNNQLDLTAGKITLGTNSITLGSSASIINASSSSYVVTNSSGELIQYVTTGTKEFPVGPSSTIYAPARIAQNGTAESIGIRTETAPAFIQSPSDATRMVNLEWVLNESVAGSNSLSTEFQWVSTSEAGSFLRSNGVFHASWNGSSFDIRSGNLAGSNPYTSLSTSDYTGNLSNQLFLVGNANGILSCFTTVSNGDWNTGSTWSGGTVPPSGTVVCINHTLTLTGSDPAPVKSVTFNTGSGLTIDAGRTLTIASAGSIANSSGGTINLGSGTLDFLGGSSVSGSNIQINNVIVHSGTMTNTAAIVLGGTLTMAGTAIAFSGPIYYGSSSTLLYACGGTKTVGNEWYVNSVVAGGGVPNNVTIDNTTVLNLPSFTIGMAGDLTIEGTMNLNATSGDITIGGNWLRKTGGVFNPNNRAVRFAGSNSSTISVEGGGTETFNYLIASKAGNSLILSSSPATDVVVNASTGDVLQLLGTNTLDLNGRTLSLTGTSGNLLVSNNNKNIIGSSGSVFAISNGVKTVTSTTSGAATFGSNVTIALLNGMNFGSNLTTVNGTLQLVNGGYVLTNAPIYATGSTLRYFSGTTYGRGAEWSATSGAGYPYNVTIDQNGTVTTLDLHNGSSALRKLAGNLTMNDGGNISMGSMTDALEVLGNLVIGGSSSGNLSLSSSSGGDLIVHGDMTRNAGGSITLNGREVTFAGATNQTITGISSFDYLHINNTGTSPNNRVIISSNQTINNRLLLTSGQFDLNSYTTSMANGSQIRRAASTGTMTANPAVSGSDQYDLRYDETMSTGNEILPGSAAIRDLEIISGTLTLGSNCTVNRDLKLSGDLHLDTYTLSMRGRNSSPGVAGNIEITSGSRNVTASSGGIFEIIGLGGNSPIEFSKTVTNPGSGTLTFGSNVYVSIGDGRIDFGSGNPVTINGILQVKLGGSVYPNSCYYGINSVLRFANTVDYGVPSTDYTWAPGSITSGLPGIPWNVEVFDAGTDLQLSDTRSLRGNLTITNGTFSLMPAYTGDFNIGGNWTRTGASSGFNHNSKKVVFDRQSAGNQTISVGSGVTTEQFYDLEVSSVSGNVVVGSSTTVAVVNELSFVSGKFDIGGSSGTLLLGVSGTDGTISGFGTSAYVINNGGEFRQYTNNNATYLFPVGDASNYTPIDITLVNGGQTGATISGKVVAGNHPNLVTATNYIGRYWNLEPTGLASSPSYNVVYGYAAADVVGAASTLYPTKWSSLGWIASPGSGANAIDGSTAAHDQTNKLFSWDGLTTFSDFTAAGDGSPLPVELLSFTASVNSDNAVVLDWLTASETNSDYFIIERSRDAIQFEEVGRTNGAGTSSLPHSYELIDNQPYSGISYYRLIQVDYNGALETFEPIAIELNLSVTSVTLYPNPATDFSFVELNSTEDSQTDVQLVDMLGRMVFSYTKPISKGHNVLRMDLSNLPAGTYLLNVTTKQGNRNHFPLIIKR